MLPIDPEDRKEIGRTGERVSAIGLGTWGIRDREKATEALVHAVEIGIDMIDTAEMYNTEDIVGIAVKKVGRENVFITTKLLPEHFRDPYEAINAAKSSLRRLNLSYVDLILIHWPHSSPIEEQVRSLERIAEEGLSRYIGVSNFNLRELERAVGSTRKNEIVVNQVKYSVLDRRVEKDLLPYCIEKGITIQAYTPIERGRVKKVQLIREIARRNGRTEVQVSLNYLISRPRVTAIPKSERVEGVEEFRGAMGWRLPPEDILLIEKL
ncbi:MAG: aldo/keto reductase [Thermoproteota archaeon]|nr:MAG: aldo/keto reductase [Candidatus Korarchaeota archaeon]